MSLENSSGSAPPPQRYLILDLARSLALLAMVIFHLTWDLAMFGYLSPETPGTGFFWYFARLTAGSFIFLAGIGLWLSHGAGIRWPAFWRRAAKILAAAVLVSLGTRIAMPQVWVFYGILHSILVSSLLGLTFLRLPWPLVLGIAAFVFALPWLYANPVFGGALIWTGLSGVSPYTADFEPLFPWFAPFLAGMVAAKLMGRYGLWQQLALPATPLLRRLAWPGKHSLLIYLLHQPLLIGLLSAIAWLRAF